MATMTILDNSVVPKWNEEPSTLDAFEERVILYVLGTKKEERYLCGPRLLAQMDPERQPYKVVKSAVTTTQLAAEGGATLVIAALRRALGARPIQEAVRLFRQLMGLRDMRRQPGESMRKWTSRFEAFIKKTGKALHQADAEIDESTFLHPLIQGILLLECSNLSPAENAAVLATSGATTMEGGSIGNSYLYVDLAASFIAQWDDEALMRRDKAPQKRSHHTAAAATTTWDLSSPSNSFLEPDTVDGGELEMALGTCDEPWEDQSWEEPEETEFPDDDWTDEFPPDDPELEDQFGSLEAAEAYAVTEFKNASSDMKNATRTFMEAKDVVSRVKHARGYFPVVGVGAFDGFQTITPRGSRQAGSGKGANTGMNSQTGKGRGRGLGKEKPPRDSRRPSPAKSRVTLTGTAKGGPTHGTRIQQVSVYSVVKWDIWPGIVRIVGRVMTLESISNVLWQLCGDDRRQRCFVASSHDDSTARNRAILRFQHVSRARRNLAESFGLCGTVPFPLVSSACVVKCKTRLFCWDSDGTTVNSTSFFNATTLTSDSADHSERYEVDQGFSLINSLQHFESFDEGHIIPTVHAMSFTFSGIFAEWAAFAVEDVNGYALLDTGASRSVGGYMMVQYVIDCLSRNTAPPWLESADPAVRFTFAGGEKAHSETRIWLPLPGTGHERFAVHIVPSEVTPILLGLDMLREFGLVINADSAHCYSTKLRCRIPVTVLPSGHLALALTPSGSVETTGETKTLVKETAADMTAAVQEDFLE